MEKGPECLESFESASNVVVSVVIKQLGAENTSKYPKLAQVIARDGYFLLSFCRHIYERYGKRSRVQTEIEFFFEFCRRNA
jgi:hypothetical protein